MAETISGTRRPRRKKLTYSTVSMMIKDKRGNLTSISHATGWSRSHVRRFIDADPRLVEQLEEEREAMTDNVVTEFYRTCIDPQADGHVTAMIFYLKTKAGWRETNNIDMNLNPQVHVYIPDNSRQDGESQEGLQEKGGDL